MCVLIKKVHLAGKIHASADTQNAQSGQIYSKWLMCLSPNNDGLANKGQYKRILGIQIAKGIV
jgi:hypothetical protein